jgi:hypothetical protein
MQVLPSPHLFGQTEPQSRPPSRPFCTPSTQVGIWQTLPEQTLLVQSVAAPQALPSPHLLAGAQEPPQSTSVSVPFFTVSLQTAAWHTSPVHTPSRQSAATVQALFAAHLSQVPPQSTSVSVLFFTESTQFGTQTAPEHWLPAQSVSTEHFSIGPQALQVPPPQSTSVSFPFATVSVQVAAAHSPPVHTSELQSAATPQILPSSQGPQVPPQSTSVSSPFFTVSVQVAATQLPSIGSHTPEAQSLGARHSTQVLAPSQSLPLFGPLQLVPFAEGVLSGIPALHVSSVQGFASSRMSASVFSVVRPPWPSQTFVLQSPACWSSTIVPLGAKSKPHTPSVQVRV